LKEGESTPVEFTSDASANFIQIGDLRRATTYSVKVIAVNSVGDSDPSDDGAGSSVTTFTTKPSAPTDVDAFNPTATCIDINWAAPADDGGLAISEYRIFVKTSEDTPLASDATYSTSVSLSHTECGLYRATQYFFWVVAVNEDGVGPVSAPDNEKTAGLAPTIDDVVFTTITQSSSVISSTWNEPEDDGGSPITSWYLTI